MKKIVLGIFIFLSTTLGSATVFAEEVLVVRWFDGARVDEMFLKKLKELRPSVKYRYVNAKRNKNRLVKLLQKYDFSDIDLVYSFGTTGTKIVRGYLKGSKPLVFNAVSTPVLSKIADSIENPGHNLTGAKLLIDMETQFEVLTKLKDIKTLAIWFDPREKQSQSVLKRLKKIVEKKGIKPHLFRIIPDAKQFDKMLDKAAKESNKLDALYFIASASFHLKYKHLHSKLDKSLLTIGLIVDYVKNGSTIALGPDAQERAYTVAEMANKILGGAKAGEIPISIVTRKNAALYVNKNKIGHAGIVNLKGLGLKVIEVGEK